jgi:vacuolar protein sorting-associated protein VTA1
MQIEKNRKYAKWKAAYIHNCLKNGETPHAGPMEDEDMNSGGDAAGIAPGGACKYRNYYCL